MGTFKLVFGIFIMVATIYLGVMLVPPYMANYQFEDEINSEAMLNTYNTKAALDLNFDAASKNKGVW